MTTLTIIARNDRPQPERPADEIMAARHRRAIRQVLDAQRPNRSRPRLMTWHGPDGAA